MAQIDVNSTFALFYPEKRPFFQEGSDLFNTYFNAVYTRSINDPIVAGKIDLAQGIEQHRRFSPPATSIRSSFSPSRSEASSSRTGRATPIFSGSGTTSASSRTSGCSRPTGSSTGAAWGRSPSVDGQIRLSKSNSFRFQFLASHTEEVDNLALVPDSAFNASRFDGGKYTAGLDGESYWGHALAAGVSRNTGNYGSSRALLTS